MLEWKSNNITCSECVFLALGIQHAERMRRIVCRLWPVQLYNIFLHCLINGTILENKKIAASSMLHEAKIAYYAFDVIVYCMYTHQTRIAYKKRTH